MGWIICWSVLRYQPIAFSEFNDPTIRCVQWYPMIHPKAFGMRFAIHLLDMTCLLHSPSKQPLVVKARQEVNSQAKDMALQGRGVINFNCTLEGYVFSKVLWHRWDISNPWPDGTCFSLLPMKCFHRTVDSVDFQWHNSVIQDLRYLGKVANGLNTFRLLHLGQAILSWTYKYPI